jgi:hypothetical protein
MFARMLQPSSRLVGHPMSSEEEHARPTIRSCNSMDEAQSASRTFTLKIMASLFATVVTARATEDHETSSSTTSRVQMEVYFVASTAIMVILAVSPTLARQRRSGVTGIRVLRRDLGRHQSLVPDRIMFRVSTRTQLAKLDFIALGE